MGLKLFQVFVLVFCFIDRKDFLKHGKKTQFIIYVNQISRINCCTISSFSPTSFLSKPLTYCSMILILSFPHLVRLHELAYF